MIKRTGVKPQDKVVEKGFRRLEQTLEEVENQQYSPQKDVIPANDVNLGSDKKRFKKLYVEDVDAFAETVKIGDIELSQDGKGTTSSLKIKGTGNSLKIGELTLSQQGTGEQAVLRVNNESDDAVSASVVSSDNIDPGTGDVNLKSTGGTVTIENTGGDTESKKDIDLKVPDGREIGFFVNGVNVGTVDSGGFKNASGEVLGTGGASFITAGNTTPSTTDIDDKTPSIGDVYIQYNSNYVSNESVGNATGSNAPIIYIRPTNQVLLKIHHNGAYYVCREHIDLGSLAPTPGNSNLYFCNNIGSSLSSYYLVKQNLNVYSRCVYNSDVSDGPDSGTPQANFGTGDDQLYDTAYNGISKSITSVANTGFSSVPRDSSLTLNWNPNSSSEGGIALTNNTNQITIRARNHKLYGATSIDFSTASGEDKSSALSSASKIVSANNLYCNIGERAITNTQNQRIFFAIPNGTTDIGSIELKSNGVWDEQLGGFSTTTAQYTNSNSYEETYKIWYSLQQGAGESTWRTSS